jgi:hypothetical protein
MPAQSQQQQKLFGLALSVKRGETPRSEASEEVLNIVDSMSEKQIKDFAETSHSGLPAKVEQQVREALRELMREMAIEEAELPKAAIPANIKTKLVQAIDKIKDTNLNYNQKLQVIGKIVDSLGIDKKELAKMSSKLKTTLESLNEEDPCWKGYQQIGMKTKNGKEVPNCVPESVNEGKFKVDDLVYNKRTKTVGIVRMGDDKYGEVKTDADGNVDVDELEKYNPIKFKHQTKAKVAPSTQKEVNSRGLFNPFKMENKVNEVDEIDTVTMDIPLFIRTLEYAREDAKTDMDLHDFAENAISLSKELGKLTMDSYDKLIGNKSVNEEKYPIAVEKFNKELIKHPMVKKAADFYKKTPAEIVKVLQQRLYTKGDKIGNTKEVYIDFKDTTSGITIKHKMKFNESVVTEAVKEVVLSNRILDFLEERGVIKASDSQKIHKDLTAFLKKNINESVNESHFKVGDSVTCIKSGMSGQVIELDKEHGGEDEKYYKVKREDGEVVKYSPNELKLNESLTEASYNFGKEEYTKKNMTPTQILDLAMAYANVSGKGTNMYGGKMENMIKVANDLAKLNGTKQMDAKSRGKEPALILSLLKNGLVTQEEYVKLYKNLLEKQTSVVKTLKNADPASRMIGGAAARQAHKDMRGEFEESVVNEDANMNKKVKMLLDKELNDLSKGKPNHQFAVMHVLIGALRDANFSSEAKKVPSIFPRAEYSGDPQGKEDLIDMYEYEIGPKVANICKWDGGDIVKAIGFYTSMTIGRPVGEKIEKLVESLKEDFSAVVGKTIFSDGKGKLFFGYYKEDDSVHFVDYNTWKKLTMKDVSKSDMHKKQVLDTILRNQKQFNKKVEYNMWYKKTNPSFEQSMDYFMKNGFVGNINKGGIKVN